MEKLINLKDYKKKKENEALNNNFLSHDAQHEDAFFSYFTNFNQNFSYSLVKTPTCLTFIISPKK